MKTAAGIILALLVAGAAGAECPSADTLRVRLARVDLAKAARTARYGQPVPVDLHEKALASIGKPHSSRDGQKVTAAMIAPVAVEKIWRALNDEEHHDLGFLPVKFSTVVDGRPRGKDRVLFQYYLRAGVGRWWASRIFINSDVHEATQGKIWEVHWDDWTKRVDRSKSPIAEIVDDIRPIETSEGSWMLVPLDDQCTLVEEYSEADAGGALGTLQALMASGAIRDTLEGMMEMAEEHHCSPTPSTSFLGPDGKPLDGTSEEANPPARKPSTAP